MIVNIFSIAARTGAAGEWVHYAGSKGAIDSFTIGLAREVATQGIRVNAVAPGLIATDLHADNGAPDRLLRLQSSIPMGRAGTAAEVAQAVAWLLSPAASSPEASWRSAAAGKFEGFGSRLILAPAFCHARRGRIIRAISNFDWTLAQFNFYSVAQAGAFSAHWETCVTPGYPCARYKFFLAP